MKVDQIESYMLAGLQRYAEFDRSDPWAYARGLAHIRQGLCGACTAIDMPWAGRSKGDKLGKLGGEAGSPGHYDARRVSLEAWGSACR